MQCTIIIPARAGSSRFVNKPLAKLRGRSLIERTWRIAQAARLAQRVVVATDDAAIAEHVRSFGGEAVVTDVAYRNGSERAAAVAQQLALATGIVVNVQGDAVLTPPWVVDATIEALANNSSWPMATPAVPLLRQTYRAYLARKQAGRASGTLVVFDSHGRALYFSKAIIPQYRLPIAQSKADAVADAAAPLAHQHIGLYAFRAEALQHYASLPEGVLERAEQLEQLRALEHRVHLQVVPVDLRGRTLWSIDYPEDLEVAAAIIGREGEL